MMAEVTIPPSQENKVIDAFLAFVASGNMYVGLAEEFAKAYLRLDTARINFLCMLSSCQCGTEQKFKNLRVLGEQIDRLLQPEETVAVPARPGLYEGAVVPIDEA